MSNNNDLARQTAFDALFDGPDTADSGADTDAPCNADGQPSSTPAAGPAAEAPRGADHPGAGPMGGYPVPLDTQNFTPPAKPDGRKKRAPRGAAIGNPLRRARPATPPPATPIPQAPVPENIAANPANLPAGSQDATGQAATPPTGPAAFGHSAGPQANAEAQRAWELIIEVYRNKPVEFTIDLLGVTPDPWQADAMRRVAGGARRLSVRAGHGVGKSAFCAWLVIWHMVTRYPQKTVLTAPTQGQLFDALFAEVKSWIAKLPPPIQSLFEVQSERIIYAAKPSDSFVSARTSSSERPEALAGVHSAHVLLIADEASAIPEAVFEAAAGSMSGFSACTILISNPTRNSGLFFMTHHQLKEDWETMHVSCIGNGRVSPDFVAQIAATYGENSNAYRVRVLGEFSEREDDVLIPAELVDAAMDRDIVLDTTAPITYGLDVSRFGDDRTVLLKRQGNVVTEIKWWSGNDTMETVGRVVNEARQDGPAEICVDSIGIGAGVADRLRELGYNTRDVNVSEAGSLDPRAHRARDALWLVVKEWLNQRACKLPKEDRLRLDLVTPTYTFNSTGKIVVEPKASLKRRRMPSPDYADALCLTFAGDHALVAGRATRWAAGKPLQRRLGGVV